MAAGGVTSALELSEKDWDAQLFNSKDGLATMLGWTLTYHTLRSKGSQPGFPDRVLVRDRVIFAELKREGGKPTDRQRAFLDGLARAGAEAYLWQPSDLDEIAKILSKRWQFVRGGPYVATRLVAHDGFETFAPCSLWLPAC